MSIEPFPGAAEVQQRVEAGYAMVRRAYGRFFERRGAEELDMTHEELVWELYTELRNEQALSGSPLAIAMCHVAAEMVVEAAARAGKKGDKGGEHVH